MAEKVEIKLVVDAKTTAITVADKKLGKLGKTVDRTALKAKAASKSFTSMGASFGGIVAAGLVVKFFSNAVDAASALQETQAKFETVFRQNVAQAEDFAKNLVDNFNVSEQSAKSYLSSIQDTLVPMGLARQAAADLSNDIVKLAADLGSFNDIPTEIVVRDLQSALVGNTETVKKYGVVLKATDIQQRAMADTAKQSAAELTNAEKVVAAYKIILEGSSDAAGDVARTQGSLANQTRNMVAGFNDLKTKIGDELIPVWTFYVGILSKVIDKTISLFDAQDDFGKGIELTIKGLNDQKEALVRQLAPLENVTDATSNLFDVQVSGAQQGDRVLTETEERQKKSLQLRLRLIDSRIKAEKKALEEERKAEEERKNRSKAGPDKALVDSLKKQREDEKRSLNERLQLIEFNLQAELSKKNIANEKRIELVREAQEAELAVVAEIKAKGLLKDEELDAKRTQIEQQGFLRRQALEQANVNDRVRKQEAFAAKTLDINSQVEESARKAFTAIGDAVGSSFADSIVNGKKFSESFTALWRSIAKQVIAQIVAMTVKLLAFQALKAAFGPSAFLLGDGGRVKGGLKGVRSLGSGGRTNGPEVAIIGEKAGETETVLPDRKVPGFVLGALAASKSKNKVPTSTLKAGNSTSDSQQAPVVVQINGDMQFTIVDSRDPRKTAETVIEMIGDEGALAVRMARKLGDVNDKFNQRGA